MQGTLTELAMAMAGYMGIVSAFLAVASLFMDWRWAIAFGIASAACIGTVVVLHGRYLAMEVSDRGHAQLLEFAERIPTTRSLVRQIMADGRYTVEEKLAFDARMTAIQRILDRRRAERARRDTRMALAKV